MATSGFCPPSERSPDGAKRHPGFCPPSAKRQVTTFATYAITVGIPDFATLNPGYLLISELQIDHFVMAITSAEAIVQHTPRRPGVLGGSVSQIT